MPGWHWVAGHRVPSYKVLTNHNLVKPYGAESVLRLKKGNPFKQPSFRTNASHLGPVKQIHGEIKVEWLWGFQHQNRIPSEVHHKVRKWAYFLSRCRARYVLNVSNYLENILKTSRTSVPLLKATTAPFRNQVDRCYQVSTTPVFFQVNPRVHNKKLKTFF